MTIQEIIDKWKERYELHKRVAIEPLLYTKEQRHGAVGSAMVILSMLEDLRQFQSDQENAAEKAYDRFLERSEGVVSDWREDAVKMQKLK